MATEAPQGSGKWAIARLPTGAKVFLILSGALLPLALIAIFATLQTTRIADQESRARLRVAAIEASRALSIQLGGDIATVRNVVDALDADPRNAAACARAIGAFVPLGDAAAQFAVRDRSGRTLCGGGVAETAPQPATPGALRVDAKRDDGLLVGISSQSGAVVGGIFFPTSLLDYLAAPSGFGEPYGAELIADEERVALRELEGVGPLSRLESDRQGIGIDDLAIELVIASAEISSPLVIAMLSPLLMWIAAAGIAWFVVDQLLIRPLRRLRSRVGAFAPGSDFDPDPQGRIPAQEIAALGETFREITQTVRAHEADLATGLVRQTKLTREVHHRVKNNLQVIASLINFHARSAATPEASDAYASIQRRVDALAVVHRYHYAEMEENRGLDLRSVVGELASNIRATAPENAAQLGIAIEIEPILVSQDVAVAVAFLVTEIVELAMLANPESKLRIVVRAAEDEQTATLRVVSPSLIDTPALTRLLETRYARVMTGLARQLRSALHHDPMIGAYEIAIAITGRP